MRAADTALVQLLKRDRAVAATAVAVLTLLAWGYVVFLSGQMAMPANVPAAQPVTASVRRDGGHGYGRRRVLHRRYGRDGYERHRQLTCSCLQELGPSGLRLHVRRVVGDDDRDDDALGRAYGAALRRGLPQGSESGAPLASAGWFFAGYVAVWIAFSAVATLSQWALSSLALLTPMMATGSAVFGGALLIAIAIYQWTPLKDTCLRACQTPLVFLASHGGFRREPLGSVRLGFAHGAYCLGCCVALMALLFVGGIMNLLWIAGITILILLERITPTGRLIPRISGALIGVAGLWVLLSEVR